MYATYQVCLTEAVQTNLHNNQMFLIKKMSRDN